MTFFNVNGGDVTGYLGTDLDVGLTLDGSGIRLVQGRGTLSDGHHLERGSLLLTGCFLPIGARGGEHTGCGYYCGEAGDGKFVTLHVFIMFVAIFILMLCTYIK